MEALDNRKKERVKGRAKIDEEMVWEILKPRRVKKLEDGGNSAAMKRAVRWVWMAGKRGEKGTKNCERRRESA
ncbi:hypothetical protein GQ457_17G017230 [Hibiscus cannabinus]